MIFPLLDVLLSRPGPTAHPLEQAIFGTIDPRRIAELVERAAYDQLGVAVDGGEFYAVSSGCVVGLHLADGRSVVLKAYQSHWEQPFLQGVQRAQRAIFASGYPCPCPLAEPTPLGAGWVTVETSLPDPGMERPSDDGRLEQSTAALVDLIGVARGVDPSGLDLHPFRIAAGDLYPTPHNPIFDLTGTGEGAEWIDDLARRAWMVRESGRQPPVIAHLDWSARNVRLGRSAAVAIYDWDSLSLAPEAVVAGHAAPTWRSTGESDDVVAPDADEIMRFIAAFAAARGLPFSTDELRVARAAAVWVMAYTARCEHALEQLTPWRRNRARTWLQSHAGALL
ncbi:MAG TPA: hypothetical protein VG298_14510 [Acidimicrobiales bacterium]|nr:hypothetical protein [Acidimicrobiales bacterium]